jgi:hypothetical protein
LRLLHVTVGAVAGEGREKQPIATNDSQRQSVSLKAEILNFANIESLY